MSEQTLCYRAEMAGANLQVLPAKKRILMETFLSVAGKPVR